VVNSSGVVIWQPRGRLRSYCNVDLRLFPFDTQHCFLAFGPWTYDTSLVTVGLNPAANTRHRKFIEVAAVVFVTTYWRRIRPNRDSRRLGTRPASHFEKYFAVLHVFPASKGLRFL